MNQTEILQTIEALQKQIENFVSEIGYDLEKFKNYDSAKRSRSAPSPPLPPRTVSKIEALYATHGITDASPSNAFTVLPTAGKLELYSFLAEQTTTSSTLDLSGLMEEEETLEAKRKKEKNKEKSRLELMKLQRDSKRRRQKFKGIKAASGCRTIMDKHRTLVNSILEDHVKDVMAAVDGEELESCLALDGEELQTLSDS